MTGAATPISVVMAVRNEAAGGFDETLGRDEDDELNRRLCTRSARACSPQAQRPGPSPAPGARSDASRVGRGVLVRMGRAAPLSERAASPRAAAPDALVATGLAVLGLFAVPVEAVGPRGIARVWRGEPA